MNHLSKLIALAAFALASSMFTTDAHAFFKVCLDNSSNPRGAVTWATTSNTISVCAVTTGTFGSCVPLESARALTTIAGCHAFNWWSWEDAADVIRLEVSTSGNNAFWLDQIELFRGDGTEHWQSGVDNTSGWCLSTQPSDGNNANCADPAVPVRPFTP